MSIDNSWYLDFIEELDEDWGDDPDASDYYEDDWEEVYWVDDDDDEDEDDDE